MKRRILAATAVMLVISSLVVAVAVGQVSGNFDLSWHIIGGGGTRSTSANYVAMGTIGQAAVGMISGASHEVCAGFWCMGPECWIYMPLMLRNYPD